MSKIRVLIEVSDYGGYDGSNEWYFRQEVSDYIEVSPSDLNTIILNRNDIFRKERVDYKQKYRDCDVSILIQTLLPNEDAETKIQTFLEEKKEKDRIAEENRKKKEELNKQKRMENDIRKAAEEKEGLKKLLRTTAEKLGVKVEIPNE